MQQNSEYKKAFTRGGFTTDLNRRILEAEEVISGDEGKKYANRKDDRSLSFKMVARDIVERAGLKQDSQVLEVCCAAGQLANELAKYINPENITATDGGVELIAAAVERYGSSGVTFKVQNVHEMGSFDEFDCVICKDSFHHFPDPVQAIRELMKPLKKGGVLYIFDLCRSAKEEQVKKRESTIVSDHEAMRFLRSLNASLTPPEFLEAANLAGIENVEVMYPLHYSEKNLQIHKEDIAKDLIKEFELDTLFAVYLLKK